MLKKIWCDLKMAGGYKKNVRLYPFYYFFNNMMIIGPVLVPFMLFKGLSYTEIMTLQSISAIALLVFEVPTGAISDKISRKYSLFWGALIPAVGLIFYIVFDNFWWFVAGEILFGIGMSLASGTDTSILYESLKCMKRKKDYQRVEAEASFYSFVGQAVGAIISSVLYTVNVFIPFWISVINIVISAVLALFFTDSNKNKSEHKYHAHIWNSMGVVWKSNRILWVTLFAILMGVVFRGSFWLYQPYFEEVGVDVFWFGFIFFGFNAVAALSSKYLVEKYYMTRPRRVMMWLGVLMAISFIVPAIFAVKAAIVVLALQQVVRGLYKPTQKFYINHHIDDKYRATVHSLVSLAGSLGFAVCSPAIGWYLDGRGALPTYFWLGTLTALGVVGLIILRKIEKMRKVRREN